MEADRLGLESELEDVYEGQETRPITFLNIHYVHAYKEKYCIIASGTEEFIANMSYREVIYLLTITENMSFN